MATGPRYRVPFRRRHSNRTDYRSRKALIKSGVPRAVVRRSNRHVRVQIARYLPNGDSIVASAYSGELASLGWTGNCDNIPGAYLTGYLAGRRCAKAGIDQVVLDIGRHAPMRGGVVFAAMKGMIDAGIGMPHDDDVLPTGERLEGKHLSEAVRSRIVEIKEKLEKGGDAQ